MFTDKEIISMETEDQKEDDAKENESKVQKISHKETLIAFKTICYFEHFAMIFLLKKI